VPAMLDKKSFDDQLENIKILEETVLILVRYVHTLWDCPNMEEDIKITIMGIYGELTAGILPEVQKLHKALQMEKDYLYSDPET
jgi:hypothetical protein